MGGIAKFVQPIKEQAVEALGLTPGCFVGLTAGPLLNAQKVLVGGDAQRVDLALDGLLDGVQPAGGHGEGVVAELQLPGFLPDLVHGEVHNPAELVPLHGPPTRASPRGWTAW